MSRGALQIYVLESHGVRPRPFVSLRAAFEAGELDDWFGITVTEYRGIDKATRELRPKRRWEWVRGPRSAAGPRDGAWTTVALLEAA